MQVIGIGIRSQRATIVTVVVVALATLLPTFARAQDKPKLQGGGGTDVAVLTEPVLIVTIASLNKLMQDVNYISSAAGQPQAGGMFTMMAGGLAQGLDMARPIAVIVPIIDGTPEPIGIVPTPDVETMLKRLEAQTGPIDKLDDGTLVIAAPGASLVYIRQAGPWAIVARQKEFLDLAPADPTALMDGMGDKYTFAARLNVQKIPADAREALIDQVRQGFEQAMAQQGGDSDNLQAASENSVAQIEQLIREAAELMISWNINPDQKIVTIEGAFTAAPGTDLASIYAGQTVVPSKFPSVVNPGNAMYYHAAASISPKVIEQSRASIDNAKVMIQKQINDNDDLDDEAKTQLGELSSSIIQLVMQTLEEGKFDIGVESNADDHQVDLAAGMFVSDGVAAADLVKDLAGKLASVNGAPTFSFDEETYKGVTVHSVVIDIPAKMDELQQTFGPQATVKIGTAPKAVYLALSGDSEKTLKAFIDRDAASDDPTDRPVGQMRVKLLPYLRFANSIDSNDIVASMIDTLSQNAESGYVMLQSTQIENGSSTYFEIGEGVLKAVGALIRDLQMKQMQQQQGNGNF